ncbi:hypothetical protein [uncultured Variovorax sp.]|uniref:hypothetical protein n=1 Tax=uncultured Variovorax sp. TaxID=114708 RepID=UPI0025F419B6|nr:hypothetical protein [uncultured Variovorax sp.]
MSGHPVPSREELASLDDEELERLALEWRGRASRGARQAYGVAHALEVEWRQRIRVSRAQQLPPPVAEPRRWWKFWHSRPAAGASSAL